MAGYKARAASYEDPLRHILSAIVLGCHFARPGGPSSPAVAGSARKRAPCALSWPRDKALLGT